VDAGYKRAFWTVFDAQVTTFIAGVVMLQYGTGAIKGFAVTLLIGIVTSMFSAIFVSRLVFDVMTRRRAETMSI
jgi:preprotein translocase subunit SecD